MFSRLFKKLYRKNEFKDIRYGVAKKNNLIALEMESGRKSASDTTKFLHHISAQLLRLKMKWHFMTSRG